MKQFFTLLILMFFVFTMNAQYIYNDFDANQNVEFSGWPNSPSIIANPDPSGVNTSPNVAEWMRSNEQWAHIYAELDGKIDFATGNFFYIKVWSPIACQLLFKLEDKTNSNIFTEVSYDLADVNQWVEVAFDFTGSSSGVYDKIVIFMDFATTNDTTYYFDDIVGPEFGAGPPQKPLLAVDVQDNFEDDGWATIETWEFQDPDLVDLVVTTDPVNASNHVADYNRTGTFEYTNAQAELDHRMDLTTRNNFKIDVYFPADNAYGDELTSTAAIKLQNSLMGGNAWMTQTEIVQEVTAYDGWVTLNFDFSFIADSTIYDKIVVQLGGEGHLVPAQFYFDNFELLDPTGVEDLQTSEIKIYPNPADDFIMLSGIENTERTTIYSVNGQQVYSSSIFTNKIDITGFQNGLYIVNIVTSDGELFTTRFVKE